MHNLKQLKTDIFTADDTDCYQGFIRAISLSVTCNEPARLLFSHSVSGP